MRQYIRTGLVVFAVVAVVAIFAYPAANTTLQRLDLQSEARTCRDALESGLDSLTAVYCNGVIREYDIMIKAYKKEQRQKLIERAQERE